MHLTILGKVEGEMLFDSFNKNGVRDIIWQY